MINPVTLNPVTHQDPGYLEQLLGVLRRHGVRVYKSGELLLEIDLQHRPPEPPPSLPASESRTGDLGDRRDDDHEDRWLWGAIDAGTSRGRATHTAL
jgi:hypothetical protein